MATTIENKTKKTFDCIAFKRRVQSEHYERTKHMTNEEWLADLRRSVESGPFAEFYKRIQSQSKTQPAGR